VKVITFNRVYSFFLPSFTYAVYDQGTKIGEVARNDDNPRKWWASNKTWTGGGDLVDTFTTRQDAAIALQHIANGTGTPDTYGGYTADDDTEVSDTSDTATEE
jgi:hypothetical protein